MNIRKLFILFLAVCMLLPGCAVLTPENNTNPTQSQTPATKPSTTTPTETQPKKIPLTLDNVNDYFIFNTKVEDVKITSEPLDKEHGKGKLTVSVSCKKRAEFESVVLTISLTTSSSGWGSMENREIQIPYDGKTEQTFNISSYIRDFVYSSPSFQVVVTGVTGYAVG